MQDSLHEKLFFNKYSKLGLLDAVTRESFYRVGVAFKNLTNPSRDQKILEVGCGTGGFTDILINEFCLKINAIDISDVAIKYAKSRFKKNAKFLARNIESSGFPSNEFDIIILSSVLHHFLDHTKMLSEIKRILRPGGKLFGFDPNLSNPLIWLLRSEKSSFYSRKGITKNEKYLSQSDVIQILNRNGFKNIETAGLSGIKYTKNYFKKIFPFQIHNIIIYPYNLIDTLTRLTCEKKYGQWMIYTAEKK